MSSRTGLTQPPMYGPVGDRFAAIRPYVQAGAVLDVGCVDARPSREGSAERLQRKPTALFRQITSLNPKTTGVDIDADGVACLQRQGYQVICADAHVMDLGRRFDTIVAGELIEHLDSPGTFLRNIRRHLQPDGHLVLSTPNPFSSGTLWKICRYGRPLVHEEHTCWFDPITLAQLLTRVGFAPLSGSWLEPTFRPLPRLVRRYFSRSFLMVARAAA